MPKRELKDLAKLGREFWRKLGNTMVGKVKKRTEQGKGVDGDFKAYSKEYAKAKAAGKTISGDDQKRQSSFQTDPPNLELTGDMMRALVLLESDANSATIGWPAFGDRMMENAEMGRAIFTDEDSATTEESDFINREIDTKIERNKREASEVRTFKIGKK